MHDFATRLLAWRRRFGRRGLPWQGTRDPYRVWLSEIMLQQTQVATVTPYYQRFVARFPTLQRLANARLSQVMPYWSGLGYYARVRNLHACARRLVGDHGGKFPRSASELAMLPGIGRSTAAAISAFCNNERAAICDGNVKRVLARYFAIDGDTRSSAIERRLWAQAQRLLPPARSMPAYTQAMMDLGATVCLRRAPTCAACPLQPTCKAFCEGRVDELPVRRAARPTPIRKAHLLVVMHGGAVLLQRRPPSGIWGGLLSLPQFASRAQLRSALAAIGDAHLRMLPERRHAFTHLTLDFMPHLAIIDRRRPQTTEAGAVWWPLLRLESAALPAPVRRLLRELHSGSIRSATRKRDTML